MRSTLAARVAAAAAICLSLTGIGAAGPATACACGGVALPVNAAATASVDHEVALLHWDGRLETIVMQLALRTGTEDAALIVPTPAPAQVSAGSAGTFAELDELTAPEVVTERRWFASSGEGATAGAPGAPTVVDQVRLGPLEATTLTGGELDGIRNWLRDNGYALRPEVIATLEPYLREGWSFVALRLTGAAPLTGPLDPIRLSFAADRLVYPMRMSSAAGTAQYVRLYVLGEHRVVRADPDAAGQVVSVAFAGRIFGARDPDLARLSANGHDYLTELSVAIRTPSAITSDFTFTAAPADTAFREQVRRREDVLLFGSPAGPQLVVGALLLVVALVLAVPLVRRVRR
ncbi:DUF2330 domain-containing protein [Nocardia sp. NPDC050435]|uniref:DUF2330 domain-containing protein n=1 Tax=Nocardia sp. NPDC050435 TaxID=3155040 RepID=UPI0033D58753